MDLRFQDYLIELGIQSQLSAPSTPQQNGVSERRNRTLLDMVRSMMSFAPLPDSFCGYALETTIYILNNVPSKNASETPYELWKGRKGSLPQIIIPYDGIENLLTYKQAMNDVNFDQWIKALDLEMESMYSNSVWTLVDQSSENVDEPCVYKRIINSTVAFLVLSEDEILLIGNENSKKGLLPYIYGIHLSKEQCPKIPQEVEDMSNIPYASAVGSLMYAMLCTGPDICYSVGIVSRYQSNPGRDHWTTVKNILKYLRRTKGYMLVYGSKDLILTGYTDSDFQTDKDARKSTSRSVFTLNGRAVVWRSIKQSFIADSTMEAEYVAACEAAKEVVWLKKFLTDLEVVPNMHLPITLYCATVVQLQIQENLEVINMESTLNESTILSGKSYMEETLQ
ncbi:gag/pol protein [Cucumis melo var. makuwa]|uniref:Gag/pol protein n=1 Tax=Cucumis melo var. makuwa TaxID=1194695 RepID=A0A5A7VMU7_CUCMM|nr:gag/pol protein [Cucumis melo var. makuwa]